VAARFLKHIGRSIRWGTEIEANRASRVAASIVYVARLIESTSRKFVDSISR